LRCRWSNAAADEFDIFMDVNGDNDPDYAVVEADFGLVTTGSVDGRAGSFVFNLHTGDGSVEFLADAPMNSTTLVMPAGLDQLCDSGSPCLSPSNPRFTYWVHAFGEGPPDGTGTAKFNAFNPSLSTGMFDTMQPNQTVTQATSLDATEFAQTPSLGFLVMSHDNANDSEAQLIQFKK
jgi:minor extracellular serine protease Vpr